jgi:hypothetical protein
MSLSYPRGVDGPQGATPRIQADCPTDLRRRTEGFPQSRDRPERALRPTRVSSSDVRARPRPTVERRGALSLRVGSLPRLQCGFAGHRTQTKARRGRPVSMASAIREVRALCRKTYELQPRTLAALQVARDRSLETERPPPIPGPGAYRRLVAGAPRTNRCERRASATSATSCPSR